MKRKGIKYNKAIFKILCNVMKNTDNIVLYNKQTNKIQTYNIPERKIISLEYDSIIQNFFETKQDLHLTMSMKDLANFIVTLPNKYITIFKTHLETEIEKCEILEKQLTLNTKS